MNRLTKPDPDINRAETETTRDDTKAVVLRWPWFALNDANRRYHEANLRELEASVKQQPEAKQRATADKWEAMTERQTTREEFTRLILGGLRIALEEQPHQLRAILIEASGSAPTGDAHIKGSFAEVFRRLEKLEGGTDEQSLHPQAIQRTEDRSARAFPGCSMHGRNRADGSSIALAASDTVGQTHVAGGQTR